MFSGIFSLNKHHKAIGWVYQNYILGGEELHLVCGSCVGNLELKLKKRTQFSLRVLDADIRDDLLFLII